MARRPIVCRALVVVVMRQISLFGATGSIGDNTLDLIARHEDKFSLFAASANRNAEKLAEVARVFSPTLLVIGDEAGRKKLHNALPDFDGDILVGADGLAQMAGVKTDLAIMAIVGFAGLVPSLICATQGGALALANKEVLVAGGTQLTQLAEQNGTQILPVDSEHNAIFQLLQGQVDKQQLDKIILTASGGPFRDLALEDMRDVTPVQAVAHPNWDMGAKISVDSATMMNKGLELIEAHYLFDTAPDKLDALIHPQSIVHSFVEFADNSILAQLGPPDMRTPIQYALTYPNHISAPWERLDFFSCGDLTFQPPDLKRFPLISLAYRALGQLGTAGTALNLANDITVDLFLRNQILFTDIPRINEIILEEHPWIEQPTLDDINSLSTWVKNKISDL